MNKQYKEKFPSFCSDIGGKYDLCLSDDIDSLLTTELLERVTYNSTKFFYDFDNLYIEKGYKQANKIIGADIDFVRGNCWGNHVTSISDKDSINKNSANLNNITGVNARNYTDKYAGSTLATVISYYGIEIDKLSERAKMLILAVDSHYLGLYNRRFHDTQKKWLIDALTLPELYDIINMKVEKDFIDLAVDVGMKWKTGKTDQYNNPKYRDGKIWLNEEGYLETELDLEKISNILGTEITLPTIQFEPYFNEESGITVHNNYASTRSVSSKEQIRANMFSYSQTYRNSASFTYLHKD